MVEAVMEVSMNEMKERYVTLFLEDIHRRLDRVNQSLEEKRHQINPRIKLKRFKGEVNEPPKKK